MLVVPGVLCTIKQQNSKCMISQQLTSNSVSNTGSSKSCSMYGSSLCTTRHKRLPFGPFDCMLYCQKYVFSLRPPEETSVKKPLSSLGQSTTQLSRQKAVSADAPQKCSYSIHCISLPKFPLVVCSYKVSILHCFLDITISAVPVTLKSPPVSVTCLKVEVACKFNAFKSNGAIEKPKYIWKIVS